MKNKKLVLGIIIGVLVGGVLGINASELISSSQVIYKDNKTVDIVLDNLFDELEIGKDKIAEAITTKGIMTTSENTLEEMAYNINSISNSSLDYSAITENVVANNLEQTGSATFTEAIVGHTYLVLFVNISAWVENSTMVGTIASGADILYTSSVVKGNAYRDPGYAQYIICKATDTTIKLTLTSMRPAYSITDLSL